MYRVAQVPTSPDKQVSFANRVKVREYGGKKKKRVKSAGQRLGTKKRGAQLLAYDRTPQTAAGTSGMMTSGHKYGV
jgi:hypothetical protein